jgi:nucleoside-diphosphate-sugar epimerase
MRSAFVTGGSGFIGGRLIERLARDGWSVTREAGLAALRAA